MTLQQTNSKEGGGQQKRLFFRCMRANTCQFSNILRGTELMTLILTHNNLRRRSRR
jgi:hypothetical protein